MPFLRVAFLAAQQMIEKAFLPVRLVNSKLKQFLANDIAQRLNPGGQGDAMPRKSDKNMDVIGHDDIATNGNIMLLGINKKDAKGVMDFIACQQVLPFISIERDEVERPNITK
jgi:hypothetical protein